VDEKIKALEGKENTADRLKALKSFGVFVKTYNMAHLLVTRYTVKEDFGFQKGLKTLNEIENKVKDTNSKIAKLEHEKKEENKKQIEELKNKLGTEKDEYKNSVRKVKLDIGTEMYNRYQKGFVRGNNAEENTKQEHTQFLFKKLKF